MSKSLSVLLGVAVSCVMGISVMTTQANADEGYYFSGQGATISAPFYLLGGRYFVDVWARYPFVDTSSASCLFSGLLEERSGTYQTINIGRLVELSADMMPFHYAPTLTLPAGTYVVHIASASDCNWTADILTASGSHDPPGVAPLDTYEKIGDTFIRTAELPIARDAVFQAEYRAAGVDKASISAYLQIIRDGATLATFPAIVGEDPNGADVVYQDLHWDSKDGRYTGSLTAKLIVKIGSATLTSSASFRLVR